MEGWEFRRLDWWWHMQTPTLTQNITHTNKHISTHITNYILLYMYICSVLVATWYTTERSRGWWFKFSSFQVMKHQVLLKYIFVYITERNTLSAMKTWILLTKILSSSQIFIIRYWVCQWIYSCGVGYVLVEKINVQILVLIDSFT